ncbi:MAG: NAD-dependent epimerase/dehydratase family protein [Promethearchaeota archaeon]
MSKLVLVDGAKGHTGTFLIKEILETKLNWKIVASDLPLEKRADLMTKETVFSTRFKNMTEILDNERVSFISADLTDPKSLRNLLMENKYDIIFHTASLYDYFAELDVLRKINVEGTRNLLNTIVETQNLTRLRFIHWSTCGVYGEPKYQRNKRGYPIPADETESINPPNNYSISKMEQELLLKEYINKYGLKTTIIRPAPIMGPFQAYGMFHVFQLEDLVRAAIFLSEKNESIGETYNLVIDPCFQEDFMEYVADLLNVDYFNFPVWWPFFKMFSKFLYKLNERNEKKARALNSRPPVDTPMTEYTIHQYLFSNQKIKNLGFDFKFPEYRSATKNTIDWYTSNKWLESE